MKQSHFAIGFIAENDSRARETKEWIAQISDIELLTGFSFLSTVPSEEVDSLKARLPKDLNDW